MTKPDDRRRTAAPLRFSPDFEIIRSDEAEIFGDLAETLRAIMERTSAETGRASRAAHAQTHGIVRGELAVLEELEPELRQGVFAEPRIFPVVMRFSTDPGEAPQAVRCGRRGLALKVVGIEGERLPGSGGERAQDFVMADEPAFAAPDARALLASLARPGASAGGPGAAGAASALRGGGTGTGARPRADDGADAHVLGATFFTQGPILYGPFVAKLQVVPVGPELASLKAETIDASGRPDALREAVGDFFESQTGHWEVRVQFMTNAETMPIEDASIVWPEDESPYRTVARITVPPQPLFDAAGQAKADEALAFSPWHGLAAHRPLGSIMRARSRTYTMSASFRSARNGRPLRQPCDEADPPV